ncbi:hypothetical protein D3C76_1773080 [compost metagenome]
MLDEHDHGDEGKIQGDRLDFIIQLGGHMEVLHNHPVAVAGEGPCNHNAAQTKIEKSPLLSADDEYTQLIAAQHQ